MSDSNNTSTIDEKKGENNGSSKKNINIGGLLSAFVSGLVIIYIHYKVGSWLVYASVLSASCELPTDIDLPPYEGSAINSLKSKPVHIFDGKAIIQFPNDPDNLKYYFIDSLRNKKKKYTGTETWTSHMFDFWITFYESIFSLNYLVIQLILKFINKLGIPQIIILLLGPLCLLTSFVILFTSLAFSILFWLAFNPICLLMNPFFCSSLLSSP